MPSDIYAKFGQIEGESTDGVYKGQCSLNSISHELENEASGDRSTGGGGAKSIATHREITFTKSFDAASPGLIKACLIGEHMDIVISLCRQSGKDKQEYLQYALTDAYLSGLSHQSADGGGVEEVGVINYGTIKWTYDKTDTKGFSLGKMEASWNRIKNCEEI
ncbi:MAG: type VI secretion system tube protein Hcp [Myxococcales bacterium]|nr:type VI secretion system tube protein Hcp [Myxococcales bacterium]